MARIPLATKTDFARDVVSAGQAIDLGVVAKTTWTCEKYWSKWCRYATSIHVDLLLQSTDPLIRDIVITAFAARVRTGYYGLQNKVKVQSVSNALSAISNTIKLAGLKSPLYRDVNYYNLSIERCLEGMRKEDPPAIPQLAVPITVPTELAKLAYTTDDAKMQAIGDLYTRPKFVFINGRRVQATQTNGTVCSKRCGLFQKWKNSTTLLSPHNPCHCRPVLSKLQTKKMDAWDKQLHTKQ